jgi:hypothetical protein
MADELSKALAWLVMRRFIDLLCSGEHLADLLGFDPALALDDPSQVKDQAARAKRLAVFVPHMRAKLDEMAGVSHVAQRVAAGKTESKPVQGSQSKPVDKPMLAYASSASASASASAASDVMNTEILDAVSIPKTEYKIIGVRLGRVKREVPYSDHHDGSSGYYTSIDDNECIFKLELASGEIKEVQYDAFLYAWGYPMGTNARGGLRSDERSLQGRAALRESLLQFERDYNQRLPNGEWLKMLWTEDDLLWFTKMHEGDEVYRVFDWWLKDRLPGITWQRALYDMRALVRLLPDSEKRREETHALVREMLREVIKILPSLAATLTPLTKAVEKSLTKSVRRAFLVNPDRDLETLLNNICVQYGVPKVLPGDVVRHKWGRPEPIVDVPTILDETQEIVGVKVETQKYEEEWGARYVRTRYRKVCVFQLKLKSGEIRDVDLLEIWDSQPKKRDVLRALLNSYERDHQQQLPNGPWLKMLWTEDDLLWFANMRPELSESWLTGVGMEMSNANTAYAAFNWWFKQRTSVDRALYDMRVLVRLLLYAKTGWSNELMKYNTLYVRRLLETGAQQAPSIADRLRPLGNPFQKGLLIEPKTSDAKLRELLQALDTLCVLNKVPDVLPGDVINYTVHGDNLDAIWGRPETQAAEASASAPSASYVPSAAALACATTATHFDDFYEWADTWVMPTAGTSGLFPDLPDKESPSTDVAGQEGQPVPDIKHGTAKKAYDAWREKAEAEWRSKHKDAPLPSGAAAWFTALVPKDGASDVPIWMYPWIDFLQTCMRKRGDQGEFSVAAHQLPPTPPDEAWLAYFTWIVDDAEYSNTVMTQIQADRTEDESENGSDIAERVVDDVSGLQDAAFEANIADELLQ